MEAFYLRTVALKGKARSFELKAKARSFRIDRVCVRLKKRGVEGERSPPPSCCRTLKPLKPPFKPFMLRFQIVLNNFCFFDLQI